MITDFEVKFWGTRGSYPYYSESHRDIGGDTSSVEIRFDNDRIFIDGGTGLQYAEVSDGHDIVLLSHYHLDHIIGLPLFLTQKKLGEVTIGTALHDPSQTIEDRLKTIFGNVAFPVTLETIFASITLVPLQSGSPFTIGPWVINNHQLHHPGGAFGYRISHKKSDKSICYLADHEAGSELDDSLERFAEKSDLIIWDGCYSDFHLPKVRGFGHSSWEEGVRFRERVGAKQLAITCHSPERSDEIARSIEKQLDRKTCFLARDRLLVQI